MREGVLISIRRRNTSCGVEGRASEGDINNGSRASMRANYPVDEFEA